MKFSLIILFILFIIVNNHGHISESELKDTYISNMISDKIKHFSKIEQANIGAFIISSASLPIFIIIYIFNIKNTSILNIMSTFAAGALIGDVFIHNLPEIFQTNNQNIHNYKNYKHRNNSFINDIINNFIFNKQLLVCWGILLLFIFEKIMNLLSNEKIQDNDNNKHSHEHSHDHTNNIIISLLGDFIHNITDGMAIGAGFNKNVKFGITLSCSIFFHEIPHEVGDFSYLLKQNMSITSALLSQIYSAIGAFVGVYLSFYLGEKYTDKIISFASGAFLYLAINTILGDLKETKSIINLILETNAFILGIYLLNTAL